MNIYYAAMFNVTTRTIQRWLKDLRQAGYILTHYLHTKINGIFNHTIRTITIIQGLRPNNQTYFKKGIEGAINRAYGMMEEHHNAFTHDQRLTLEELKEDLQNGKASGYQVIHDRLLGNIMKDSPSGNYWDAREQNWEHVKPILEARKASEIWKPYPKGHKPTVKDTDAFYDDLERLAYQVP